MAVTPSLVQVLDSKMRDGDSRQVNSEWAITWCPICTSLRQLFAFVSHSPLNTPQPLVITPKPFPYPFLREAKLVDGWPATQVAIRLRLQQHHTERCTKGRAGKRDTTFASGDCPPVCSHRSGPPEKSATCSERPVGVETIGSFEASKATPVWRQLPNRPAASHSVQQGLRRAPGSAKQPASKLPPRLPSSGYCHFCAVTQKSPALCFLILSGMRCTHVRGLLRHFVCEAE
jgi:hypothetical protein